MLFNIIFVKKGDWNIFFNITCATVKVIKSKNFLIWGILEMVTSIPLILLLRKLRPRESKAPTQSHTIFPFHVQIGSFPFLCGFVNQITFTEPVCLISALAKGSKLCHVGYTEGERDRRMEITMFFARGLCAPNHPIDNIGKGPLFFSVGKVMGQWIYHCLYTSYGLQPSSSFVLLPFSRL